MAGAGGQYAGYSSDGGKASDEEGPGDPRWFGIAMAAGYLELREKDRQHREKRRKTLKVHAEGKENLEVGGEARDHGGVAAGSDAGGARAAGGVGAGNDGGGARAAAPAPVSLKVSINLKKLAQMPASVFLKHSGRNWPNAVCR